MIKTKSSYDNVVASLKQEDEIQTVYVPELGRHADVVFVQNQLYIAQGSQQNRVWYPVNRETLGTGSVPSAPLQAAHYLAPSNFLSPPVPDYQTPPPPYTDLAGQNVFSENSKTESGGISFGKGPSNAAPSKQLSAVALRKKVVDPKTGERVTPGTPGAIALDTYRSRQLVHPETGERALPDTLGAIPRSTFFHRRLVDPVTGKRVPPNTPNAIPFSTFNHRRPVDPKTGKRVPPNTPNAIPISSYNNRLPVHPETGERVSMDTPGAIPATRFRNRLRVDPKTGARVPYNTPNSISASAFQYHKSKNARARQTVASGPSNIVPMPAPRNWRLAAPLTEERGPADPLKEI